MTFVSEALITHRIDGGDIGVVNIFSKNKWRSKVYVRILVQICMRWVMMAIYLNWFWILIRLSSRLLAKYEVGEGDFLSSATTRKNVLTSFVKATSLQRKPCWEFFWVMYFLCAKDGTDFIDDYTAAWSAQPDYDSEVFVFIDNGHCLIVPCSQATADVDDKAFLEHLRSFYNLSRMNFGLFELFGVKSSQKIEIVELLPGLTAGNRVGLPLDLGRHGSYNRQIHYFKDASSMRGTAIRERLLTEGVLTICDHQINALFHGREAMALNIVRDWDPRVTSIAIIFPTALSLIISIVWSIVAAVHFKADVQASVQTGFTIGSYVVTAGALLIALVAFLDTKINAS
ncbi:hypothetical protein BKA58DRAFT_373493 [Alternaria rosae]|uniref:uncharacterized protein n=1 Tax=Alternaria rosae TaxID=1187941 RepID=UPI001E8CA1B9|nr:uncharacterized protein BKA58DRAFT_373493 [Alternaria rosae]KAH6882541.1 hypothetical protein BKA58DRAFT_373493 [Alternaria rosae]